MAITISGPTGQQKYLTAGSIDVIRDCEWAVFDGDSIAKKEVPFIELTEYQPVGDQFVNRATNFSKLLEVTGGDAYKNTYKANATGNVYTFPFFTTEMRSKSSNWAEDKRVTETAGAIAGLFGVSVESTVKTLIERAASVGTAVGFGASFGIEYPKMWQGADSGATYSFDFYLFNTVSPEKIVDNWNLTYLLSYNNSYSRRSLVLQDAPVLYKVKVPGVRSSPVASMKELKIEMVGQIRNIKGLDGLPSSCNIPEAYHISITMEDLFVESRQLMEGVKSGNIVEVFVG